MQPYSSTITTSSYGQTKYYLISSTGMCDTVGEKTPSWMTDSDFFNDWTECCRKSWKFDLCLSRAPPGAIPETLTEVDTQIIYYAIPSSGKCVEKDEKTPSCKFPVLTVSSLSHVSSQCYIYSYV